MDKYLEKEDDGKLGSFCPRCRLLHLIKGIEPRHRKDVRVDVLVDLEATQEDHPEVREPDWMHTVYPNLILYRQETKKMLQCNQESNVEQSR